jgi:tetratricopeptide (TPR) repeat protein
VLAQVLRIQGRLEEARTVLEPFRTAAAPEDRIVRAEVLTEFAASLMFGGALDEAGPPLEEALTTLELEQAWAPLANALVTRAVYLIFRHRLEEANSVMSHALELAHEHDLPATVLRAGFNLSAIALNSDRLTDAVDEVERTLAFARARGDRASERSLLGQMLAPLVALGRWDEASATATALLSRPVDTDVMHVAAFMATVAAARGDEATLDRCLELATESRGSTHVDQRVDATNAHARLAIERGAVEEALELTRAVIDEPVSGTESKEETYALAVEAALVLGHEAATDELIGIVDGLPPARATPLLRAGRARLAAERAHRAGDADAAGSLEQEAIELLRSVGARPLLARALLERAQRRDDAAALAEARSIYSALGASQWLSRIDQAAASV